jgi:hypothetical protein
MQVMKACTYSREVKEWIPSLDEGFYEVTGR